MCGICGVVFSDGNEKADFETIQAMNEQVVHRGPDGEGYHCSTGIGMGMRRLGIIGLKSGDQPIYNEDNDIALICNGEIYNYLELSANLQKKGHRFTTRSDAEVIVHGFEEYGFDCLHQLRGMFAFALWDRKRKRLFCARDRMGIKPLHYAFGRDGNLYFASEVKSILAAGMVDRSINFHALEDLLKYGFVLGKRTLFKGVDSLLPGHFFLYHEGDITIRKYWDVPFMLPNCRRSERSEQQWCEVFEDVFRDAVRLHMRSDVPVSGWLSPGIDSSAIVKNMSDFTNQSVKTLTIGFSDHRADEICREKILSRYPGYNISNQIIQFSDEHFNHLEKTVWHEERPDITGVHTVQMLLATETAKQFKVVLTGEGADEIFGGYPWYRIDKLARKVSFMPRWIQRGILFGFCGPNVNPLESQAFFTRRPITVERYADLVTLNSTEYQNMLWSEQVSAALNETDEMQYLPCDMNWLESLDPFEKIQYIEMKTRLGNWITHGLDAMSMANSLEARVPFLDHKVVECAASIPPSLKMKYLREKHILRRAMATHLPRGICNRRKFGLRAPCLPWLKGKLPVFAEDMLSEEYCRKTGYFSPSAVRMLLKKHQCGGGNYVKPLLLVVGTHLWHSLFIDL